MLRTVTAGGKRSHINAGRYPTSVIGPECVKQKVEHSDPSVGRAAFDSCRITLRQLRLNN
jgi:hypothetical protein